ncbi:hypothetical protein PQ465_18415 [Sphingobacterium oryzagri]|uniref:peptidylprolyl isomerase n=1 Tax=Sphingobacterium oryzagri TaxID=3025669 RepID=A0ABY7WF55_9SPHI|nr:hypothetical protein [Sphingobacterium sp. KACC 22765]WDF68256.1 hypothetical protein PQ465_18415 [Sphingobacterium sp. KACC 22765]
MKNLFKPLFALAIIAATFTSCMEKDNTDYDAENLKSEQRMDSLLSAENNRIQTYLAANSASAWIKDTITFSYRFLDKKPTRGIYYQVVSEPTDNTYEYKITNTGASLSIVMPKLKLKYKASLLDGTVVQSDETGSDYSLGVSNPAIFNDAWFYSFLPYSIKFNNQDYYIYGLTKNGLKKGSKFKMVTPSLWAFKSSSTAKMPANSPLVYEFEVMTIE